MPQQIGWSVEAKLLYEIKQLTKSLASRSYIQTFPNFASFPTPGITGTLYVDEATGDIYVWNGTSYVLLSSGITALNGLIAAAQLFATGSTGTDFNISSVGTTHTFNIPTASATNRGLLSSADWTTFNSKIGGTGTTNYVAKFTASGTVGNSILQDDGTRLFTAASTTVGNLFLGTSTYTTVGGYKYIVLSNTTGAVVSFAINGTEQAAISLNGSTSFNLGPSANIPIGFFTNSNERMRITSAGDVGIGTTSPTAKLHVGDPGTASDITLESANTGSYKLNTFGVLRARFSAVVGGAYFGTESGQGFMDIGASGSVRMRLFANGRVGVNTTTDAGYQFDVNGSGRIGTVIFQENSPFFTGANIFSTAGQIAIGTQANNNLGFFTNNTEVGRFTNVGRFGIGTTTPSELLDVNGRIRARTIDNNASPTFYLTADANGVIQKSTYGPTGGSGTLNYVAKWTPDGVTLGNSQIFDNGTNVGVNNTSPSYRLDVIGSGRFSGSSTSIPTDVASDITGIFGGYAGTPTGNSSVYVLGQARGVLNIGSSFSSGSINAGNLQFISGVLSTTSSNAALIARIVGFQTNGTSTMGGELRFDTKAESGSITERMRITAAGDVGIGTTSPSYKLDVNGIAKTVGELRVHSSVYPTTYNTSLRSDASALGILQLGNNGGNYILAGNTSPGGFLSIRTNVSNETVTSGIEAMRIFNTGRIGVGTATDAGYQFDVNGSARVNSSTFFQTNSSSNVFFDQVPNANNSAVIRQTRGSQIFWTGVGANANDNWNLYDATNTAFRLTMTTGGNFGIGTTSPIAKLDVVGSINATTNYRFNNADFSQIAIVDPGGGFAGGYNLTLSGSTPQHAATGPAAGYYYSQDIVRFFTNTSAAAGTNIPERLRITSGGNVLIGTTTDTGETFQVAGTARVSQSAFLATASGGLGVGTTTLTANTIFDIVGGTGAIPYIMGGSRSAAFLSFKIYNTSTSGSAAITIGEDRGTSATPFYIERQNSASANPNQININNTQSAPITISTTNVERMRITPTGNVGIGTTTPATVAGYTVVAINNATNGGMLDFMRAGSLVGRMYADNSEMNVGTTVASFLRFTTNSAERMRITSAGDVGIGAAVPSVYSGFTTLSLNNATNGGLLAFQVNGTTNAYIYSIPAQATIATLTSIPLTFVTNSTEKMRITSGGNVLIGTTTDSGDKLQIFGNTQVNSNTGSACEYRLNQNGIVQWRIVNTATSGQFRIEDGGATPAVAIIGTSYNFGIAQTTFGTNATRTLAISTGVAPTTSPADAIQMYSADITAGNAAPHFRTENGAVVKVYQETTGVGAATLVGGGGTTITDTDTFDGYTLKQIVKALRNQGLLA